MYEFLSVCVYVDCERISEKWYEFIYTEKKPSQCIRTKRVCVFEREREREWEDWGVAMHIKNSLIWNYAILYESCSHGIQLIIAMDSRYFDYTTRLLYQTKWVHTIFTQVQSGHGNLFCASKTDIFIKSLAMIDAHTHTYTQAPQYTIEMHIGPKYFTEIPLVLQRARQTSQLNGLYSRHDWNIAFLSRIILIFRLYIFSNYLQFAKESICV